MGTNSIVRVINTKATTEEENKQISKKHLEYILRKDATHSDLCWENMVDMNDVLKSFGFFAKCAGKNNGRPLKHIVISYAVDDEQARLNWQEYLVVTKEIAKFYGLNYQMVAAVHDNIEKRPHAHIVMDCFNVSTEKKFSEGVKDLEKFKDFIDDILEKHKIPKLLRRKNKMDTIVKLNNVQIVSTNSSLKEETYYEEPDYINEVPYYPEAEIYVSDDCTTNDEIKHFFAMDENFKSTTDSLDVGVFEELAAFFMEEPKKKEVVFSFDKLMEKKL